MKILIVKTSAFGDIIQSFPVIKYLKVKYPEAQIDWVAEKRCAELSIAHPDIRKTHVIDTESWRKFPLKNETWEQIKAFRQTLQQETYDLVVDLQGNLKSGLVTSLANSKMKIGFGKDWVREKSNLYFIDKHYNPPPGNNIRRDYLDIVKMHFQDNALFEADEKLKFKSRPEEEELIKNILNQPELQHGKVIMVCPSAAWPNKQLTEETLTYFLKELSATSPTSFLFIWGTKEEQAMTRKLHQQIPRSYVCDRLSLTALQSLMDKMEWVLAMDSLPLHLAATTTAKTFAFFGASSANKYNPPGPLHFSFQGTCPYGSVFERRCDVLRTCKTGACMRSLNGRMLFQAFQESIHKADAIEKKGL